MKHPLEWYRSSTTAPRVRPAASRAVRNWLRARLPEPDVRGKTIVLYSRRTFPKLSWAGTRSDFHGLFSEFHSVLGALAYAEVHGSAGVRVDFRSPLYEERDRGPNWWTYFFQQAAMPLHSGESAAGLEVHLNGTITKYGTYGGFSDVVGGPMAYLYPMTYGLSRSDLNRLLTAHVHVRPEILESVARFIRARFEPGACVVGVHYRGTDATHNWTGAFANYRTSHVPYDVYADEVRRVLDAAAPRRYQIFVATDEIDCLEFMRNQFGDRVIDLDDAPRVRPHEQAVHLDLTLPVSNYQKGKSALVDSLILAATNYLVKGRSNLSDASLAFNPQLPYSFLPDVALLGQQALNHLGATGGSRPLASTPLDQRQIDRFETPGNGGPVVVTHERGASCPEGAPQVRIGQQ
jgi:hypothetical protein